MVFLWQCKCTLFQSRSSWIKICWKELYILRWAQVTCSEFATFLAAIACRWQSPMGCPTLSLTWPTWGHVEISNRNCTRKQFFQSWKNMPTNQLLRAHMCSCFFGSICTAGPCWLAFWTLCWKGVWIFLWQEDLTFDEHGWHMLCGHLHRIHRQAGLLPCVAFAVKGMSKLVASKR